MPDISMCSFGFLGLVATEANLLGRAKIHKMAKSGITIPCDVQSVDLNALAIFVKIVQAGSFSAAAAGLKMPKTTVSAKFAALEEALGVSLIHRTTRKLHITPQGQRYFEHCLAAMCSIEEGNADLSASRSTPQGLLTITAPADIGQTLMPRVVSSYLAKYPEVSVQLLITNRVADLIAEGVDLAIRAGPAKDSSLIGRRFFDLTGNIWSSPHYLARMGTPTHPKDLSTYDFVGYRDCKTATLVNGKAAVTFTIRERARSDDFLTIQNLLQEGVGVGWLPDFLAREAVYAGALVPAVPGWRAPDAGAVSFLYKGKRRLSINVSTFIDHALQQMRDGHPSG